MRALSWDPCIFCTSGGMAKYSTNKEDDNVEKGVIGLQVDDSIIIGNELFLSKEEQEPKRFPKKGRKEIGSEIINFNGVLIHRDDDHNVKLQCLPKQGLENADGEGMSFGSFI